MAEGARLEIWFTGNRNVGSTPTLSALLPQFPFFTFHGGWPARSQALEKDDSVFDHISISVHDLQRSLAFYDAVLAPLGCRRLFLNEKGAGWSTQADHDEPPFAIVQVPSDSTTGSSEMGHIAFKAPARAAVVAFFEAAIAHGAERQEAPRLWLEYGPNYFAAFVGDPDGYNIEAVCHVAE